MGVERAGWMRVLKGAALVGFLTLATSAARGQGAEAAQTFGSFTVDPARPTLIFLTDTIDRTAVPDFQRALAAFPDAETLVLDSRGGAVVHALGIADEVSNRDLATVIPSWGGCYSACAFVFFAGPDRVAFGPLGVHQVSADQPDLNEAQQIMADILEMLGKFDAPTSVISAMLRTPPDEMHVFSAEEIAGPGFNRGNVEDPAPLDAALAPPPMEAGSTASKPNGTLLPRYGTAALRAGFTPDPYNFYLGAGGSIDATVLGGECTGFVGEAPDFRLNYTAGGQPLFISVSSTTDTTLAVLGPDRVWACDDDRGPGLNPLLTWDRPQSGQYDIWIGVIERTGAAVNAQLLVSETGAASSAPVGPATRPEEDDEEYVRVGSYRDWDVFTKSTLCLGITYPIDTSPASADRDAATLVVAATPDANPELLVTVLYYFALSDEYYVTAVVDGGRDYDMLPYEQYAEPETVRDNELLLAAMRNGVRMDVYSIDAADDDRRDTFSLLGMTAATQRVLSECRL